MSALSADDDDSINATCTSPATGAQRDRLGSSSPSYPAPEDPSRGGKSPAPRINRTIA